MTDKADKVHPVNERIPQPNVKHGLAIIGPYGTVWTDKVFDTPEKALEYLEAFWRGNWKPHQWKLAAATQTVAVVTDTKEIMLPYIPLPEKQP
jgi:hypothetical protein